MKSYTRRDDEVVLAEEMLTPAGLDDLDRAAVEVKDNKVRRAITSMRSALSGDFTKPVANFKAFATVLNAYLRADRCAGWLFVREADGMLHPQLVTQIKYHDGQDFRRPGQESVTVSTVSYGPGIERQEFREIRLRHHQHSFHPADVANRRVADILAGRGLVKETAELLAAHKKTLEHFNANVREGFARQFVMTGQLLRTEDNSYLRRGVRLDGRKVVNDVTLEDYGTVTPFVESCLFDREGVNGGIGAVPESCVVRVFDLKTHEFLHVHADYLQPYVYDKALRDRLILPATHAELLDVLTHDLDDFIDDVIDGKNASNVILCKGEPGLGKTLTAEVYAELIERPLYSVHAGALGTKAAEVSESLQQIFQLAHRWNVVLLLDECDVFVARRSDNLESNAICAEFLRALEYFPGLMFVTTNRGDNIDDAFEIRCAATIEYQAPVREQAAQIWQANAKSRGVTLSDELLTGLLDSFPSIAPRDIRELFRLTLRMCKRTQVVPTIADFRKWAVFRAIKVAPAAA